MNQNIHSPQLIRLLSLSLMLLGISLTGCGKSAFKDGYAGERGKVTGQVRLDGSPLPADYQIMFMAKNGSYIGTSVIGENGQYELKYDAGPGLPVGEYDIQFSNPVVIEPPRGQLSDDELEEMKKAGSVKSKTNNIMNSKYYSTGTSGLTETIKSGENKIDFEITK